MSIPDIEDVLELSPGELLEVSEWARVTEAIAAWDAPQSNPEPALSVASDGDPAGPLVRLVTRPLSPSEERMYGAGGDSNVGNGWSGVATKYQQLLVLLDATDDVQIFWTRKTGFGYIEGRPEHG